MYSMRNKVFAAIASAMIFFAFSPIPVMIAQAQEAPVVAETAATPTPTQPEEVATVVVNQDVSIPYGQWVEDLGDIARSWLIPTLLGVMTWTIGKYVPVPLRGIANNILRREAEQLLEKAISYGINATAGASHDKTLDIPVANSVLRNGLNYALANGWPKLIDFLDGPDGILQKMFSRLDIPIEATAKDLNVPEAVPSAAKMKQTSKTVQAQTSWVMRK